MASPLKGVNIGMCRMLSLDRAYVYLRQRELLVL